MWPLILLVSITTAEISVKEEPIIGYRPHYDSLEDKMAERPSSLEGPSVPSTKFSVPDNIAQETMMGSEKDLEDDDVLRISLTNFDCLGKIDGFYADVETKCRVFHYCQTFRFPTGLIEKKSFPFTCPKTTIFKQEHLTCVPQEPSFRCEDSPKYFYVNKLLYRPSATSPRPPTLSRPMDDPVKPVIPVSPTPSGSFLLPPFMDEKIAPIYNYPPLGDQLSEPPKFNTSAVSNTSENSSGMDNPEKEIMSSKIPQKPNPQLPLESESQNAANILNLPKEKNFIIPVIPSSIQRLEKTDSIPLLITPHKNIAIQQELTKGPAPFFYEKDQKPLDETEKSPFSEIKKTAMTSSEMSADKTSMDTPQPLSYTLVGKPLNNVDLGLDTIQRKINADNFETLRKLFDFDEKTLKSLAASFNGQPLLKEKELDLSRKEGIPESLITSSASKGSPGPLVNKELIEKTRTMGFKTIDLDKMSPGEVSSGLSRPVEHRGEAKPENSIVPSLSSSKSIESEVNSFSSTLNEKARTGSSIPSFIVPSPLIASLFPQPLLIGQHEPDFLSRIATFQPNFGFEEKDLTDAYSLKETSFPEPNFSFKSNLYKHTGGDEFRNKAKTYDQTPDSVRDGIEGLKFPPGSEETASKDFNIGRKPNQHSAGTPTKRSGLDTFPSLKTDGRSIYEDEPVGPR